MCSSYGCGRAGGQWTSWDQWTPDIKVAMLPRISASLHLHSVIMMHGIGGKAAGPRRDSRMSDTMIKEEILLSTSSPSGHK